jgi:hypothetical protein
MGTAYRVQRSSIAAHISASHLIQRMQAEQQFQQQDFEHQKQMAQLSEALAKPPKNSSRISEPHSTFKAVTSKQ